MRPRLGDLPQLVATALLLAFVAAPIATLVSESLRVDGRWSLGHYRDLATRGDDSVLVVPVTTALRNSLQTAFDATWISLLLGLLVALVLTRRSRSRAERRLRGVLDGFFMLPLGVSAVTLGFGFLVTLGREPLDLRTWPLLVPIAQALVALPLVVRTLVPVLAGIDDRQRQAAASLGAGPLRTALTVDVPVVARPLLAAAGFAFAVSLGEFGATSFLSRADHPTLPIVIFRLIGNPGTGNYGMALAASVVLALTTAAGDAPRRAAARPGPGSVVSACCGLDRVSISYDGTPAVVDASLQVPDGSVVAVLGPSGCGKSTLLRAVAGLERPGRRHDQLGRRRPGRRTDPQARVRADVPGRPALRAPHASRATSATRHACAGLARHRGDGRAGCWPSSAWRGTTTGCPATLSGGERQRVALARSLAAEPRLLLLDEPLSALDAGLRERLAGDLRDILRAAGTTTLVVTHDQEEAFAVADRLVVMREGRIVQQGPIADVWAAPGRRRRRRSSSATRGCSDGAAAGARCCGRAPAVEAAAAVALRRSALTLCRPRHEAGPGRLSGEVRSARATPDQVRLVVAVEGLGEVDAVGSPDAHAAPGG